MHFCMWGTQGAGSSKAGLRRSSGGGSGGYILDFLNLEDR